MEWTLIWLGGLLGSSHCLGMCGPFALLIGSGAGNLQKGIVRQLVYSTGRVCTYAFGGAVAGFIGMRLSGWFNPVGSAQGLLSILAGVLLVLQGVLAAGFVRWRRTGAASGSCAAVKLFAEALRKPGAVHIFIAGIFTGFLPCGLVYAYLSLAAASGSLWQGMGIMAVFGAGTAPLLMLVGLGAPMLAVSSRRRMLRLAALCVVITGAITFARGALSVHSTWQEGPARCPLCVEGNQAANSVDVPLLNARTVGWIAR